MTTPDLSRIPRLRLRDGTVLLPALFRGADGKISGSVPANAPNRVQRDGEWYRLAASQPRSYLLYEAIPERRAPRRPKHGRTATSPRI